MKCRIILYIDTHHGVRNILYGHSQWSERFLMDTLSGVKISNGLAFHQFLLISLLEE